MPTNGQAVSVFISYAREDTAYCAKLLEALTNLTRERVIEVWTDHSIFAGDTWDQEIRDALEHAQLILLLVSPPFIASEYIHRVELQNALERSKHREVSVVPILIRPADWDHLRFLQALPSNETAISKWTDPDDAWLNVLLELKQVIHRIRGIPYDDRAAPKLRPAPVKTIPEKVAKLCDRTRQEAGFADFYEDMRNVRPGAAQVYVLIEDDVDRPEFLVDRLFELRVPSLAMRSRGERRASCLRETGNDPVYGSLRALQRSLAQNFFSSFGASAPRPPVARMLLNDAGLSLHSHILADQTLDGEKVAADADKLVEWLVQEFWAQANSASTQWLVFIIFRFSSLDVRNADLRSRLVRRLRRFFDKDGRRNTSPAETGAPALLLPPPDPLQLADVKDVLERFPINSVREVNDLAQQIFIQINSHGTPRLDDLHLALERLRGAYLETGSFQL